ncbi:endonuclease/exonuclease/phosphatase family protein [Candidatus Sumerlaeota bacterium]|nr:endonuclease/exonuclease/phosphatase family protein [Candidatus Sumerlaeota bacterium]
MTQTLNVISFNVRYSKGDDGENSWKNRRAMLFYYLREQQPDLIGAQEILRPQLKQITEALPGYQWIGVGRENGKRKGEYAAIFYRADRLKPLDSGTFWLSEKPEKPGSMSWNTACTRICTLAQFLDLATSQTFWHYNTHFDHVSGKARENSARLIIERMKQQAGDAPIILTGDLNTGEDDVCVRILKDAGLRDTFRVIHPYVEGVRTFHDFNGGHEGEKIDYIFVSPQWKVQTAAIDFFNQEDRYPSDHYPVTTKIQQNPKQ